MASIHNLLWLMLYVAGGVPRAVSSTSADPVCQAGVTCPTSCQCTTTSSSHLQVDCSNRYLTRVPPRLPLDTEVLKLNSNNITNVSNHAFFNCTWLLHLDISCNEVAGLEEDAFAGIDQLQVLLLHNNNIDFTSLPGTVWQNLTRLLTLFIHDNYSPSSTDYNDHLFLHLKRLTTLKMDGLPNVSLGDGFSSLKQLQYLTIYGDLRYITNHTFRSLSQSPVKAFKVRSGVLTDVEPLAFAHFSHLEILDLSFNPSLGFTNVSKSWYGLRHTNISTLLLERAAPYDHQLITIKRDFYKGLENTKVKKFVLDANNIITIESVFAFHTPHLKYLSLAYNRLVQVLGILIDIFFLSHLLVADFSYQTKRLRSQQKTRTEVSNSFELVKGFEKSSDAIEGVVLKYCSSTGTYELLDVSVAHIVEDLSELTGQQARIHLPNIFSNRSLLHHIYSKLFTGNGSVLAIQGVGYLDKTMPMPNYGPIYAFFPPNLRIFNGCASLTLNYKTLPEIILFGQNTIQLLNYSKNSLHNVMGPFIIKTPPRELMAVDFSDNGCTWIDPNFAKESAKYLETFYLAQNDLGNQLANHVNDNPLKPFSNLISLDLSDNNIRSLPTNVFINQIKMQHLKLAGNSLRLIQFNFSHMLDLTLLDLSKNLLDQLNPVTRRAMDMAAKSANLTVDLTDNPLQCSCATLKFLEWVLKTKVNLLNWREYVCMYRGQLRKLSDLETVILPTLQIDCHSKAWVVASSVTLISIAILASLSFFLYRHRFEIRYLCLKLIIKRREYEALEQQDEVYKFDAFVCFDQRDRQWVDQELIPKLDSEDGNGDYRLLIHHRDFEPGTSIEENVLKGIQSSRKIVLVLTRYFVESTWCQFELEMSRMRCFDEGKDLILAILLEEDLPIMKLSRTLRSLLRRNTYIQWPENCQEVPNFWINLNRALAAKPNKTITCQCGKTINL